MKASASVDPTYSQCESETRLEWRILTWFLKDLNKSKECMHLWSVSSVLVLYRLPVNAFNDRELLAVEQPATSSPSISYQRSTKSYTSSCLDSDSYFDNKIGCMHVHARCRSAPIAHGSPWTSRTKCWSTCAVSSVFFLMRKMLCRSSSPRALTSCTIHTCIFHHHTRNQAQQRQHVYGRIPSAAPAIYCTATFSGATKMRMHVSKCAHADACLCVRG